MTFLQHVISWFYFFILLSFLNLQGHQMNYILYISLHWTLAICYKLCLMRGGNTKIEVDNNKHYQHLYDTYELPLLRLSCLL